MGKHSGISLAKSATQGIKIVAGMKISFKKLVLKEREENGYLIFSENGKIIKKPAIDIKLEGE
ncbi:MAG: hypothetical protein ABI844_00975 [Saprospiraceae bacterium]